MNTTVLIGRLTKDPSVKQTESGTNIASFTLAVDRPYTKGEEKQADFIPVKCFGKSAEFVGKYLTKGKMVGVTGRIQTGSYEKQDGSKVYTTDVIADRVEFLEKKSEDAPKKTEQTTYAADLDDDIPFE